MSSKSRLPMKSPRPRPRNASSFIATTYGGGAARMPAPEGRVRSTACGERRCLPAVVEPKDLCARGHRVEDQARLGVPPAADHFALAVLGEPALTELGLELVKRGSRCHLDYDVDVYRRPDFHSAGPRHPQLDSRAADEHDVVNQLAERVGGDLKQLDVHAVKERGAGSTAPMRRP